LPYSNAVGISFSHGSMACALSQACGAQATDLKRQIISTSGDGGLAMLMDELQTAKLPVEVVVFNNGSLAFMVVFKGSLRGEDSTPPAKRVHSKGCARRDSRYECDVHGANVAADVRPGWVEGQLISSSGLPVQRALRSSPPPPRG
jgi:hypothetical protein